MKIPNKALLLIALRIAMVAFSVLPLQAEELQVESALEDAITGANVRLFIDTPSIQFSIQTRTKYAADYLKDNPRRAERDDMTTQFKGVIAGDRYRVSSSMTLADGKQLPDFVITYDGEYYNCLNATGSPSLLISKSFVVDSDVALPLGTVAFIPYSFLFPTSDDFFVPNISSERITNNEVWEDAFKSARILEARDPRILRIKFIHPRGTYYIVTFSIAEDYFPVAFEKYGADGLLAQKYTIETSEVLGGAGKAKMRFPKKSKLETFLVGWPRNSITIETVALAPIEKLDDIKFSIDSSKVNRVYEADSDVRTQR